MNGEPKWLSRKALLLLHQESLAQFGGAAGIANEGLLDSALARPLNTYAYRPESTIADLAASCAFGLARNHAFVDGNKRAAFLAIGVFLAINGYRLIADKLDAIQTVLALAAGEIGEAELADWITRNCVPAGSAPAQ